MPVRLSSDYNKSSSHPAPGAGSMQRRTSSGFTLVEIAVVVALIAILLTAGAKIASGLLEGAAVSVTQKKQQIIKEALISFSNRFKRLPCPDTDQGNGNTLGFVSGRPDGRENLDGLNCAYPFGVVPDADLGLPQEMALDGWQNYFLYRVTENFAWNRANTFANAAAGTIEIMGRNPNGMERSIATGAESAVFAIISVGRDGAGAITVAGTRTIQAEGLDELANTALGTFTLPPTLPPIWVRDATDRADAAGGPYNDIVLYANANEVRGVTNNVLNQDVQEKINRARLIVFGHLAANCRIPYGPYDLGLQDLWNNDLIYRGNVQQSGSQPALSQRIPRPGDSLNTIDPPDPPNYLVFALTYPGRPEVAVRLKEVQGYLSGFNAFNNGNVCD